MTRRALALITALPAAVVLMAGPAWGHPGEAHDEEMPVEEMPVEEMPVEEMPPDPIPHEEPGSPHDSEEPAARVAPTLALDVPRATAPGEPVTLTATLHDPQGQPVADAPVTFLTSASWGAWLEGEVVLGSAVTDAAGAAKLTASLQHADSAPVHVRFAGSERFDPAEAAAAILISATGPVHVPEVGVSIPGLGIWWLVVLLAVVWGLYLLVAGRVLAIARAGPTPDVETGSGRRRFLTRFLVPAGLAAVVASVGTGLVGVVTRSPRTHSNLEPAGWTARPRHRTTPLAHVGERVAPRSLPPLLEREVSFAHDVMPILRAKGGPHAHPPAHSPAPHRVRLDSYDHIMEGRGLVVPGEPESSRLVTVLLEPSVQMPPSVPPLPAEEVAVIASWVAQGARNN